MTQITVHSIPGSPYGRAVLATLEEKGAKYRPAPRKVSRISRAIPSGACRRWSTTAT